jgi:radical SAM-linked protein
MTLKLRVRLSKTGMARFFSHLDLQRTLERVLRRAGLPIAYTQGFSPHPKVSFASALATGTSSEGEFLDVELAQPMEPAEFVAQANAFCPPGLRFVEARPTVQKGDSLMALIDAAEYRLTVTGASAERLDAAVQAFLAAAAVEVTKEGRTGARQVNIRPQVYQLEVTGPNELRAVVQTGPQGNLKPEDLVSGLRSVAPDLGDVALSLTHRLMLYRRDPETGALIEPWEL